ncbi:MAG: flotillin family protein [Deltaproteobacteria bacterium]|nr:flotillin family protein [Deltaproteobacteria bacterium]
MQPQVTQTGIDLGGVVAALIGAVGFVIGVLVIIAIVKAFMYICRPNEILIFSGRKRRMADGEDVGFRVVTGGRAFRVPVVERVARMDMSLIPIDLSVHGAFSKGIPLQVHAIANVKVSSDPRFVGNAIERFLDRGLDEIRLVAKQTLEGALRGVVAQLTPEEVNEDRLKFAERLLHHCDDDFNKLGLALDTLKIQHVADDTEYLNSIGRKRIADVLRDAEIAESNNDQLAQSEVAEADRRANVALETANTVIVRAQNELKRIQAEYEGEAGAEEAKVEPAYQAAKAVAEQELQKIRAEVEKARLESEVIIPAEAGKVAQFLLAKGAAAPIAENGAAAANVLRQMAEVWAQAGAAAKDIFLIRQLEEITGTVVRSVANVQVGEVNIIDSGDGKALPAFLASFPASVTAILGALKESTGVDVPSALAPLPAGSNGGRV